MHMLICVQKIIYEMLDIRNVTCDSGEVSGVHGQHPHHISGRLGQGLSP